MTLSGSLDFDNEDYVEASRRGPAAPLALVRGRGCELFDADGRRWLDLCAGVAVCSVVTAMKTKAAAAPRPGAASGRLTRSRTAVRPSPRDLPASSSAETSTARAPA